MRSEGGGVESSAPATTPESRLNPLEGGEVRKSRKTWCMIPTMQILGVKGGEGVYQEIPLYFEVYHSFLTC